MKKFQAHTDLAILPSPVYLPPHNLTSCPCISVLWTLSLPPELQWEIRCVQCVQFSDVQCGCWHDSTSQHSFLDNLVIRLIIPLGLQLKSVIIYYSAKLGSLLISGDLVIYWKNRNNRRPSKKFKLFVNTCMAASGEEIKYKMFSHTISEGSWWMEKKKPEWIKIYLYICLDVCASVSLYVCISVPIMFSSAGCPKFRYSPIIKKVIR